MKAIDDLYEDREEIEIEERSSIFRGFIEGKRSFSPDDFLELTKDELTNIMRINCQTKVKLMMRCMMKHAQTNELKPMNFDSGYPTTNLKDDDVSEIYDEMAKEILMEIAMVETQENYWYVVYIIDLRLHTASYNPLRVGSWFPAPAGVKNTKGVINPKIQMMKCVSRIVYL